MRRLTPREKWLALVFLLVAAALLARRTEFGRSWLPLSFDQIQALPEKIRAYDPVDWLVYILLYTLATLVLVPGTAISFLGAVLYGAVWGTVYTWAGAVAGASLVFLVVRSLGRDYTSALAERLLRGRFGELDAWINRNGFRAMLLVRLLPIFPFNGVNLAAPLTSIRFAHYLLATAIGILPGTFVYQYLFANLGRRALKPSDAADAQLVLPIAVFTLFLAGALLAARRFRPRPSEHGPDPPPPADPS
jgi:uncharacterized membrane protein YdjX (TVP38/TMEM64 family)